MSYSPDASEAVVPRFDVAAPRLSHIAGKTPLAAIDWTAWKRFAATTAPYRAGYELS